jgi:hypothetical protein
LCFEAKGVATSFMVFQNDFMLGEVYLNRQTAAISSQPLPATTVKTIDTTIRSTTLFAELK